MFKSFAMIGRLMRAGRVLGQHGVLPPAEWEDLAPPQARLLKYIFPKSKAEAHGRSGERLARALAKLGPSYIKMGQFLATRPDVIGVGIARDLAELQDRLPPFPGEQARQILAEDLGDKLSCLGDIGEAIAAASIAQVHKVELRTNEGEPKQFRAIKILRPGIERDFARELEAFAWAARQAEYFGGEDVRRMKPVAGVDTLARSVALEMDLRLEAAAATEFAGNIKNDPDFRIPAVDWDLTTRRVLATEWIDATPLKDIDTLRAKGHDLKRIATNVIQSFLRHALRDGFFHADMHPGNLFVDAKGNLVAVDFGIMGRLDPLSRRFMAETLAGFLARDYRRVADIHLQVGFVPPRHSVEDFAQALRAIGEPVFGRPASNMSMARLLTQLFEVTHLFDMQMQPQLVMLQKTMVVVEGVARQLDPQHSIWDSAKPIVEQWMIDQVGPQARLNQAAEGFNTLGRAIAAFPDVLKNAEQIAAMLSTNGLRLHPDSTRAIADAQTSQTAHARIAIWIGALALAALAIAQF
ncbi:MAG: 2-polyprenylphenol 6-hydroxylase [Alphaproteobacteria bacterium]|nr:2-polyprenylphenol 6-hydroxylase [Alphaproteobacteria bacterium]